MLNAHTFRFAACRSSRLSDANFSPEYASVRAPLFALNALFGGFTSAFVACGTAFEVNRDPLELSGSLGFELGPRAGQPLAIFVYFYNRSDVPAEVAFIAMPAPDPNAAASSVTAAAASEADDVSRPRPRR